MKFPKSQICSSEFPLTQSKSTYLNASSSIRDHRARVIIVKVSLDDLSAHLDDDPQKKRHFEDKFIRYGMLYILIVFKRNVASSLHICYKRCGTLVYST